jgi:hypothetical protein
MRAVQVRAEGVAAAQALTESSPAVESPVHRPKRSRDRCATLHPAKRSGAPCRLRRSGSDSRCRSAMAVILTATEGLFSMTRAASTACFPRFALFTPPRDRWTTLHRRSHLARRVDCVARGRFGRLSRVCR